MWFVRFSVQIGDRSNWFWNIIK